METYRTGVGSSKYALLIIVWMSLSLLLSACGGGSGNTVEETPPVVVDPGESGGEPTVTDTDDEGNTDIDLTRLAEALDALPVGVLTDDENADLVFMREEEKLAGDVYRALYSLHGINIFQNIANSEDTHTAAVKLLLSRYELADPAEGRADGDFQNADLQQLYDALVARGSASLLDALYVGAAIEELDIADLDTAKSRLDNNDDIKLVYDNLQKGSRNHLRAFHRQIVDAGGSYTPEYLSQEAFDDIVNSDFERG
ncbi:MAG: DUF2202 domain-containing protein [Halieaceae bacterium]|jgi:hypothetical protein|nr:DUF2202 domain-containing protein [Halieaceae bacterium]